MAVDTFSDVDISALPLKTSDPVLFKDVPIGVFVCCFCKKKTAAPMMRCSCLVVFYCGTKCQESDWPQHHLKHV